MRVAELAESLAVTSDTVRYYTRLGYLTPIRNSKNGYKEYDERDQMRLKFILNARQLGFSVADIGLILSEADKGKSPCHTTRQLMEQRLDETERRFRETVSLRKKMKAALKEWQNKPDRAPTGNMICYLIEEYSGNQIRESKS